MEKAVKVARPSKVYDIETLQKKGHCVRPERGTMVRRITEDVARLFNEVGQAGVIELPYITYAGAAVYLRKLRAQDLEKYGDVALATVEGHPALFLHGCYDVRGEGTRLFHRQNEMRKVLPPLLDNPQLTKLQVEAVKMRFGIGDYWPSRSMEQTASVMNVTRARVGQMLSSALARLGFEPRWRLG